MSYPNDTDHYTLTTDASLFGIVAIISQRQQWGERVIAYASKTLNKSKQNYNTKYVLNLHEEKLYSSQFKVSIPLATEKTQGVQVFAIARQNTYIQSKSKSLMRDENGEKIPRVQGLVEATEGFEMEIGLRLAACIISIKVGSG